MKTNDIIINTNSKQVIGELKQVQDMVYSTSDIIQATNNASKESYDSLNNAVATATLSQIALSTAIISSTQMIDLQRMAMQSAFAELVGYTSALDLGFESLQNHTSGVLANIEAIKESILQMSENTIATDTNTDSKDESKKGMDGWQVMAGIAAGAQAILTTLSIINTTATIAGSAAKLIKIRNTKKETNADEEAAVAASSKAAAGLAAIFASGPFIGIVAGLATVAAIAGGIVAVHNALKTPAMATGGVVSSPTMALVGEGRYPEAVVPLGESPQFANMKADIANAVIQGMNANNAMRSVGKQKNLILQLNIDGRQFAEATISDFVEALNNEGYGVLRADAMFR